MGQAIRPLHIFITLVSLELRWPDFLPHEKYVANRKTDNGQGNDGNKLRPRYGKTLSETKRGIKQEVKCIAPAHHF